MITLRMEPGAGLTEVAVAGDITDEADFSSVMDLDGAVVFELSAVRRFNSGGVSRWMSMIRAPDARRVALRFERADAFLFQQAMIPALIGGGRIDSMLLTFACEHTETGAAMRAAHFPNGRLMPPPAPTCPRCGRTMALDTILDGAWL